MGRVEANGGLADLLQGAGGTEAAFSGEMQALLMQLSPQVLQRLDALFNSGMTLPQAASSFLT